MVTAKAQKTHGALALLSAWERKMTDSDTKPSVETHELSVMEAAGRLLWLEGGDVKKAYENACYIYAKSAYGARCRHAHAIVKLLGGFRP